MKKLLQTTGLIFALFLFANVGMAQSYTLSPADGATGVSTSPTLTITFDGAVSLEKDKNIYIANSDWGEIHTFYTGKIFPPRPPISPIPVDPRLFISENTLTIYLSGDVLSGNTKFYVFADAGAIKVGGDFWNDLYDPDYETSIWSFTTAAAVAGPEIISVSPTNGATDVSVNPTLIVEFDKEITIGNNGRFTITDGSVEGASYSTNSLRVTTLGNQLTIEALGLAYNTSYYVEIDPGFIENYAGLDNPLFWTFTTETKPPQWSAGFPTLTQSLTGFTFTGKTDLDGTYYFVVTNSSAKPTPAQIKAGKSAAGNAALKKINGVMIADTEFSKPIVFAPELSIGQTYFLHAVATSSNGKDSDIETFTIDRTTPSINNELSNPTVGYDLFQVDHSIVIAFTKKVFDYNEGVISSLSEASFTLKTGGTSVPVDFSVSEDGLEVTLKPIATLLENTNYEVEIKSLSDVNYNQMAAVTRTFQTDKTNVWVGGGTSSSWMDSENWDGTYTSGKSVLIPLASSNYPVIDTDITVNNFTIEAGAVVTQSGGLITVLGDFDLLSSEVTNASYLPKGGILDVKGETRVHQHIVPEKGLIDYLMGPPTDGANYANFGTPYLIKYYENPTDSWVSIGTTNMLPGVGYAVYSLNDLIFRGNINRNSIEVPLQRTNGKGYGWNLLGNPYTASINWGDLGVDTSKVENNYWMWDTKNRVYGAFNQEAGIGLDLDGEIPSNHGFLVKLKIGQTSGRFSFAPSAMVVNTKNYLKSTSKNKPPHIKISAGNSEFIDQFAVAFVPEASDGVDKYDTEKFFGNGNPFQIFTVAGSTKLSINSLPDAGEETTINLGYQSSKAGSYTIRLKENYLEHSEVILTDLKEGITVDLLHDGSYTFNVDRRETNSSRFTLTFPERVSTLIKKIIPLDDMTVYLKDGDVIVDILRETGPLTYELVGVSGNIVHRGHLYSGVNNLGKFPSGLYIINTRNDEGTIVSKKLLVTR